MGKIITTTEDARSSKIKEHLSMLFIANVAHGPTKAPCSTKEYLIKKLVPEHCVEPKFQSEVKDLDSMLLERLAAQKNMLTQLVTVIALSGQRAKCSQTS